MNFLFSEKSRGAFTHLFQLPNYIEIFGITWKNFNIHICTHSTSSNIYYVYIKYLKWPLKIICFSKRKYIQFLHEHVTGPCIWRDKELLREEIINAELTESQTLLLINYFTYCIYKM